MITRVFMLRHSPPLWNASTQNEGRTQALWYAVRGGLMMKNVSLRSSFCQLLQQLCMGEKSDNASSVPIIIIITKFV